MERTHKQLAFLNDYIGCKSKYNNDRSKNCTDIDYFAYLSEFISCAVYLKPRMKCISGSTSLDTESSYSNREYVRLGVLIQKRTINRDQIQLSELHASNFSHDISFIICGNCFWCASLLAARTLNDHRCPSYSKVH